MFGGLLKSTSRLALVAAATAIGGVSAQAADLGGNCCADLEERVAELEATTARKGNRKVSLTVSGQVNQAIVWHDYDRPAAHRDGTLSIQDNGASQTRFRFVGTAKVDADRTIGYNLEIGIDGNEGVGLGLGNNRVRQNNVFLDSKTFGRLTVGQQSQVTDGVGDVNLANIGFVNNYKAVNHARLFYTPDGITNTLWNPDGDRRQAIRYDSPTFAGFIMSASWGHASATTNDDSSDQWDVALRYAGEFNGIRLAAAIGYREEEANNNTNVDQIFLGSASVMHVPSGLYIAGGYGDRDRNNNGVGGDVDSMWFNGGIQKNWFGIGNTTLYAEYATSDWALEGANTTDTTMWGVGIVQNVSAAASDLYLNYRSYDVDINGRDVGVVMGGMIVRF